MKRFFLLIGIIFTPLFLSGQNYQWVNGIGGTTIDQGSGIVLDTDGNAYLVGSFQGTVDFDAGVDTSEWTSVLKDIFVAKYDSLGNHQWALAFGSDQNDEARSIAIDDLGYIYLTGNFADSIDFDPGPGTAMLYAEGFKDSFIAKYDADGNYMWAIDIGGPAADDGYQVQVDGLGNLYATGWFSDSCDFDAGPDTAHGYSNGSSDIYIAKYDTGGNWLWHVTAGSTNLDQGYALTTDASGNVFVTGIFIGSVDFDPTFGFAVLSSPSNANTFIAKYNSIGSLVWAKNIGGPSSDQGNGIWWDSSDALYLTGLFGGTADFDPNAGTAALTATALSDIFIAKYSNTGAYVWAQNFGGGSTNAGAAIRTDGDGKVYVAGHFGGTADFDPGPDVIELNSAGGDDIFVACYQSTGAYIWARGVGSATGDKGLALAVNDKAQVFLTGYYAGTADFDPGVGNAGMTPVGNRDIFLAMYGPCTGANVGVGISGDTVATASATAGSFQWVDCDQNYAVLVGATSNSFSTADSGHFAVIVTEFGCIDTSACYMLRPAAKGGFGAFVTENTLAQKIRIYPNPTTNYITVDFGEPCQNAKVVVTDINGKIQLQAACSGDSRLVLDTRTLANGLYFVNVRTEFEAMTLKMVKH